MNSSKETKVVKCKIHKQERRILNYRPNSLLTVFSRIFYKFMYK